MRCVNDTLFVNNMVLVRQDRLIRLVGSPSVQEQAGLDIAGAIADGNGIVYDYTRKPVDEWIENITFGFSWAQEAAEKWAAARVCDEWQNMNQKSERYRKEAMEALDTLRKIGYGTKDGDNPSHYSVVTPYKTVGSSSLLGRPPRYRSPNAFGGEYD